MGVSVRPRRPIRRSVALAILALAVLSAIVLFSSKRRPAPRAMRVAPLELGSPVAAPMQSPPSPAGAPAPRGPPPARPSDPPPIIDEISVEKPEVCSGEENLITVRAHTDNGTDAFLHSVVDGTMGVSVPVRLWLDDSGRVQGNHSVTVFGRTNVAATAALPDYRVKDCQPARVVAVEHHLRANSLADFDFVAKIVTLPARGEDSAPAAGDPSTAPSCVWSLADGDTATTPAPAVTHSY